MFGIVVRNNELTSFLVNRGRMHGYVLITPATCSYYEFLKIVNWQNCLTAYLFTSSVLGWYSLNPSFAIKLISGLVCFRIHQDILSRRMWRNIMSATSLRRAWLSLYYIIYMDVAYTKKKRNLSSFFSYLVFINTVGSLILTMFKCFLHDIYWKSCLLHL